MSHFIKILMVVLLSVGLMNNMYGQTKDMVSFVADWEEDEAHIFKITSVKQFVSGSLIMRSDTLAHVMEMRVVKKTEDGFQMKWTSNDFHNLYYIENQEQYNSIREILYTEPVYYTVATDGAMKEIENWSFISNNILELFYYRIDEEVKKNQTSEETINSLKNSVLDLYSSKEHVEEIFLKDMKLLHLPYNYKLVVGDTIRKQETILNLMGGSPGKATSEIFITKFDRDDTEIGLCYKTLFTENEAEKFLDYIFDSFLIIDSMFQETLMNYINFDYSIMNDFIYDNEKHTVLSVRRTKNAVFTLENTKYEAVDQLIVELIK